MTRDELKDVLKPHIVKMQVMNYEDCDSYQEKHIVPLMQEWLSHANARPLTVLFDEWNQVVMEIANEFTVH